MRAWRVMMKRLRMAYLGVRDFARARKSNYAAFRRGLRQAAEGTRYFYLGPDAALTRLKSGHLLYVDPQDEDISAHLIGHGHWERWIHHVVLQLVHPGHHVVEVGANLGYYTVAMARRVGSDGSVTALEANPRLAGLLRRSVDLNAYNGRVRVLDQAAADAPGRLSFVTTRRHSGGGHTRVVESAIGAETEVIDVESVRLDDLGVERADFIRLDAEGSEPLILRGAERLLQNPDVVVCLEWSAIQMQCRASMPEFVGWLAGQGFRFWKIEETAALTPMEAHQMIDLNGCDVVMSRRPVKIRPMRPAY